MNVEEARDLLPWYAAGALEPEEAKAVEASLQQFPQLDRELAELRALHSVVGTEHEGEAAFRPQLLDEVHRRIDAYEQARSANASTQTHAGSSGSFIAPLVERLFGGWNAMPIGARVAVAAQFAVIAVLVGVIATQREEGFTTASGPNATTAAGQRITVVFQPDSSAQDIQDVLDTVDAQIVSGPSGQSAYVLDLGDIDRQQTERVLESLREQRAVVRFAAPIE